MTKEEEALGTFIRFVEENPYTGTAEQIVTLSQGIAAAGTRLDASTFSIYKEQSGIGEKVFSKLKVIGKTFLKLTDKQRRDVVKGLPASYSTIPLRFLSTTSQVPSFHFTTSEEIKKVV